MRQGAAARSLPVPVAAGRRPNSAGIGLETVGLSEGDWIDVDDQLRVNGHDWLYAIGDINKRSLLTHSGKYQARVACATIGSRPPLRWLLATFRGLA